jgi:hypothetical protein
VSANPKVAFVAKLFYLGRTDSIPPGRLHNRNGDEGTLYSAPKRARFLIGTYALDS